MGNEAADPFDFVEDCPTDSDDDTGITLPTEEPFEPGGVLGYSRTGRFAPQRPPESFGDRMGRWSLICVALLVPALFLSVLFYVPLIVGFVAALTALIANRGRSIGGWVGMAVHGSIVGLFIWLIVMGR